MSDTHNSFCWILILVFVTLIQLHEIVTLTQIASTFEFPSDCVDSDGVQRNHMDSWTSSAGSCDQRTCYDAVVNKWKILYDCPAESEPFDSSNCQYVSNTLLSFPYCCPTLECSSGSLTTVSQPPCYDEHNADTCNTWKNITNCLNGTDTIHQEVYNFIYAFCRQTCGLC